jgi:hypothetical protein
MRLQAGTDAGTKKLEFIFKGDEDTAEKIDNIGKESISLLYTGSGSAAAVTIDNDKLAITVTGAADGIEILFEDFPTIEQVVARLNDTGVFVAIQLETESNAPANRLDAVTSLDVKTAVQTLRSDLYALIAALESSRYAGKENVEKEDGAANIAPDVDADGDKHQSHKHNAVPNHRDPQTSSMLGVSRLPYTRTQPAHPSHRSP